MAATLSADEEQVGPVELFGFVFFLLASSFFFSVSHRLRNASSPPSAPPGGTLALCVLRVAHRRRAAAVCGVRCAVDPLRNESGAETLYRFLALYCSGCITASSSPAAQLKLKLECCETGRARLHQPPLTHVKYPWRLLFFFFFLEFIRGYGP